jgi:lipoprotein-anchoring transpeptidase ErfK/SrfK
VSGAEAQVDDASVGADLVAIHGWEDRQNDPAVWGSTSGLAVSHACVRVPANFAAGPLSAVPNGTLVHLLDQ